MNPIRFAPLVLRQVVRHRIRSGLTMAGVAAAMFLFCGVQAVQRGAHEATQSAAADTTLIVYRKDRYCPFTSRLPQSYEARMKAVPGVASVTPMAVTISNCRTSLDVVTFRGVPADAFEARIAPQLRITSGSVADWRRRGDAALLGATLARRRGLSVGQRFGAAGVTAYVAGVFESDEPQHQNAAYVPLEFLQFASGGRGGGTVTQFIVRVTDPAALDATAAAIDAEFAHDAEPTQTRSERAFFAQAAGDVLEIVGFTRWLGWGCLLGVLGLIGNAMVLSVQDRIKEHAILQTLGYRGGQVAGLIVAEGAVLSLAGGLLGLAGAAGVLAWRGFSLSVEGHSIPIEASAGLVAGGLTLAAALGIAAGLVPAWQASRREIAGCFRAV